LKIHGLILLPGMLTPNAFRKKAERNLAETDGDLVNIGAK